MIDKSRAIRLALGVAVSISVFSVGVVQGIAGLNGVDDDPALSRAAWADAKLMQVECPAELRDKNPAADCLQAENFPETDPSRPLTTYERSIYCNDGNLNFDEDDLLCSGFSFDRDAPNADILEAYGVDQGVAAR